MIVLQHFQKNKKIKELEKQIKKLEEDNYYLEQNIFNSSCKSSQLMDKLVEATFITNRDVIKLAYLGVYIEHTEHDDWYNLKSIADNKIIDSDEANAIIETIFNMLKKEVNK